MKQRHPDRDATIDVLLQVASHAACESSAEHPEDIAAAMSMAIESAGVAIRLAWARGLA